MIQPEYILARLEDLMQEWALHAALKPQGKEAFDYGRACGVVRGFALAKEEIEKMINQDASNEALKESKL